MQIRPSLRWTRIDWSLWIVSARISCHADLIIVVTSLQCNCTCYGVPLQNELNPRTNKSALCFAHVLSNRASLAQLLALASSLGILGSCNCAYLCIWGWLMLAVMVSWITHLFKCLPNFVPKCLPFEQRSKSPRRDFM